MQKGNITHVNSEIIHKKIIYIKNLSKFYWANDIINYLNNVKKKTKKSGIN